MLLCIRVYARTRSGAFVVQNCILRLCANVFMYLHVRSLCAVSVYLVVPPFRFDPCFNEHMSYESRTGLLWRKLLEWPSKEDSCWLVVQRYQPCVSGSYLSFIL